MARATSFLCQGNHTLLMQITGAAPAALFLFSGVAGGGHPGGASHGTFPWRSKGPGA